MKLDKKGEKEIFKENQHLREEIKRKTIELKDKTRELQIESSLERVRAVAMSMHSPADVAQICRVIFGELSALGFSEMRNAQVNIHNEAEKSFLNYDFSTESGHRTTKYTYGTHPVINNYMRQILRGKDFHSFSLTGTKLNEWRKMRKSAGEKEDSKLKKATSLHYCFYTIGSGSIGISSWEKLSTEKLELLKRFRNVFKLSYQRYIDIANAEAQAREAQIEAALEKVRSRSLAMHRSEELQQVVNTIGEQLAGLKIEADSVNIVLLEKGVDDLSYWIASPTQNRPQIFKLPYFKATISSDIRNAAKKELPFFSKTYSREVKNKWFTYAFANSDFKFFTTERKKFLLKSEAFTLAVAHIKNTGIQVNRFSRKAFTDAEAIVLKRLALVFEQAYTRFLDLQKAEALARESQIQLALERVRARTMAMQSSHELAEVSFLLNKQVAELGIPTRGCAFNIYGENESTEWFSNLEGTLPTYKTPRENIFLKYYEAGQSGETLLVEEFDKKRIKKHYDYLHSLHLLGQADDVVEKIRKAMPDSQIDHVAYFKYGYLLFITLAPAPEAHDIFKRFAREFEQTYTRFLDLQKAEAQAREAQIEAGLETVRSTSLAMHHANDLEKVVTVLFDRLIGLDVKFNGAGIYIFPDGEELIEHWVKGFDLAPVKNKLPLGKESRSIPIIKDYLTTKKTQTSLVNKVYSKKAKDQLFRFVSRHNDASRIPTRVKSFIEKANSHIVTLIPEHHCLLGIDSFTGVTLTENDTAILKRFAKVFEQAYVRFLDLQKAESQARESQIQLSLERVRARAMAMQNSDELNELIGSVFTELTKLDLILTRCVILIYEGSEKGCRWWMANSEAPSMPMNFFVKYADMLFFNEYLKAWQERTLKWQYILDGKNKIKTDDFLFAETELSRLPDFVIAGMRAPHRIYLNASFNNFGNLTLASLEPLSDAHFDILLRFAKVFDLTYTRFNDLKKAEAQARESQIQLALERVRARTMAMQKSDELADVISIVRKQLQALNVSLNDQSVIIFVFEPNVKDFVQWVASPFNDSSTPFKTPYFENPILDDLWKARVEGESFYSKSFSKKDKDDLFNFFFNQTDLRTLPEAEKKWLLQSEHYESTLALEKNTAITLSNFSPTQHASDVKEIMKRMAKVFEQAYVRFLDVQKAEAQARESQIQLAMERVRARTMAMHNSRELAEVAKLLVDQVKQLGLESYASGFNIWDKEHKNLVSWMSNPTGSINPPFEMPIHGYVQHERIYTSWKNREAFLEDDLSGEALDEHYRFLRSFPALDAAFSRSEQMGIKTPERQVHNNAHFSNGYLLFITPEPCPQFHDIFIRFAKVFDQTYTRFLDLQKAEAQAREAQIEAALEKIRSRSLAMHKSDELKDVIASVFQRLKELALDFDAAAIQLFKEGSKDCVMWVASPDVISEPLAINLPYDRNLLAQSEFFHTVWNAKTNGKDILNKTYSFDEKNKYYAYVIKYNPQIPAHVSEMMLKAASYTHTVIIEKNSALIADSWYEKTLSIDDYAILKRFAKVFEQAYIRFLDLQKAEAQAREAQIEASLERVRSRTMGMQRSEELNDVAAILFNQVNELGIKVWTAGFNVWSDDDQYYTDYITSPQGNVIKAYTIDTSASSVFSDIRNVKQSGEEFWVQYLEGEELQETYRILTNFSGERQYEKMLEDGYQFPSHQYDHFVFGSKVSLMFITYEQVPEAHDIFKRFGKVFDQTYTRFLDLQKAEAQAREAQIEAALEKIRSRSLAMHKSDELKEVVKVLYEKLVDLNLQFDGGAGIHLFKDGTKNAEILVAAPGLAQPILNKLPFDEEAFVNNPIINDVWYAKETGVSILNRHYSFEEKNRYFANYVFKYNDQSVVPEFERDFILKAKGYTATFIAEKNSLLGANSWTGQTFSDADFDILKRFAKVFEQTYVRFLDLQKAEAQAREAQIEAALERVRSRSLAMHQSIELEQVVGSLFDRLAELGVSFDGALIFTFVKEKRNIKLWIATNHLSAPTLIDLPYDREIQDNEIIKDLWSAIENEDQIFSKSYSGEVKNEYFRYTAKNNETKIPESIRQIQQQTERWTLHCIAEKNSMVGFDTWSGDPTTEADLKILKRFAKVFDQAYVRFLDLQKAEALAREAQIEAALERVRTKMMSMQNSSEVGETVLACFHELHKLGVKPYRSGIIIIHENKTMEVWVAHEDHQIIIGRVDMTIHPLLVGGFEAWKSGEKVFTYTLEGSDLKSYFTAINNSPDYPIHYDLEALPDPQVNTQFFFNEGALFAFSPQPISEMDSFIFRRFALAFGQTYRRYLDIQKAEAQAREAQIETSLERLRSKTMAMHNSNDVSTATAVMFNELSKLGVASMRCGIGILHHNSDTMEVWAASVTAEGHEVKGMGLVGINGHPLWQEMYRDWELKKENFLYHLQGEAKDAYYRVLMGEQRYKASYLSAEQPDHYCYVTFFSDGVIFTFNQTLYNDGQKKVLKRFASVFSLTYRRYIDLKNAEAQARESQIEASLERVRTLTMAMRKSDDMLDMCKVIAVELQRLNIQNIKLVETLVFYPEKEVLLDYEHYPISNHTCISTIEYTKHPAIMDMANKMLSDKEGFYHNRLTGQELTDWIAYLKSVNLYVEPELQQHDELNYYFYSIGAAALGLVTFSTLDEVEVALFKRLRNVFELAYTRYADVEKAETSAQAALHQASIDRVRAEIASMRTVQDLDRITPLIWRELTILGITFIRCGVFIMDEEKKIIHTFLTTPEGKAIAAFHLPFDTANNLTDAINGWRTHQRYIVNWLDKDFQSQADVLIQQGSITSREQYLSTIPKDGIYLHFLPFLQGMLYVGHTTQLGDEDLNLIQSVADAFSTAYARYEDFNKLEAAKKQVENTLTDLKQAQQQLVQSEKMASLGELTAGIAHEIQNPLNFVNNFSEVSKELLDEMKSEMERGNQAEVAAIANDVIENLKKITHHGKRAGDIVKSMLQHSRKSNGQKELTDINALCDEYLRLAYHGLRAKDKTFNAKFETDFDATLPNIPVLPQDLGRVILNLINNAFYAVSEKAKLQAADFQPLVKVFTKNLGDKIEIRIEDNGTGILEKVKEKIFQPFFTTKPTGQGTGLGLSLSYDIVKAHNGEVKVETVLNEGTTFVVSLSVRP